MQNRYIIIMPFQPESKVVYAQFNEQRMIVCHRFLIYSNEFKLYNKSYTIKVFSFELGNNWLAKSFR